MKRSRVPLIRVSWASVLDFSPDAIARRLACIFVMIMVTFLLVPPQYAAAVETAEQVRILDLEGRVKALDPLIANMAVMQSEIGELKQEFKDRWENQDKKIWAIILMVGGAFGERMLDAFGINLRRRRRDNPAEDE